MNSKGMTLIELITTFALTAVIVILLINIILLIKDVYNKTNVKTNLYINQSNLSNILNSKINNNMLDSYESCSTTSFCYNFNFIDGESIQLTVSEKKVKFGKYIYKLSDKTKVVNPTLNEEYINIPNTMVNDSFIIIKIPIICDLYPNIDFGVNLVYPYNSK